MARKLTREGTAWLREQRKRKQVETGKRPGQRGGKGAR